MSGAFSLEGKSAHAAAWRDDDNAPWMITLPAGEFMMGASDDDKFANDTERPVHAVAVPAFALARGPVTVAEFRAFAPSHAINDDPAWPVNGVGWEDANNYCGWLTQTAGRPYRLPTEPEWEYACRADTLTPFSTGWELTAAEANFLYRESGERIGPGARTQTGTYPPNAFGFHDLHGNVCEWVADAWRPSYAASPADPMRRTVRGGGWDYLPRLLRSSWRDALPPETRRDNLGFRVATSELP